MTSDALLAHLAGGTTHVCSCWAVTRRDGVVLGFTDHDRALTFDGVTYSPQSGLTARALASTTGLSVNNTEAMGVLSAAAITEADIMAGRYDGAQVVTWLVQWDNVASRQIRFRGTIAEITRAVGGFQADAPECVDQRAANAQAFLFIGRMAILDDSPICRSMGIYWTCCSAHQWKVPDPKRLE